MTQLFLSHSSHDNFQAIALRDWLLGEGWDELFLDLDPERGIVAGERWERALHQAASRCDAVLFLVSTNWLASEWCLREFELAQRLNKRIFGVLVEDLAVDSLPDKLTATWQLVNLAGGTDHQVLRAVHPDTGDERHVNFSASGLKRLRAGLMRAGLDPRFFEWPPAGDPQRAPYRGMRALEAEDAGIFFGREAPTIELLAQLRGLRDDPPPRLMVILGASGAGKSSFLRAGLLPRLTREDKHFLTLPIIRPENDVLEGDNGLVACLSRSCTSAGLKRTRADLRQAITGTDRTQALSDLLLELAQAAKPPELPGESDRRSPTLVLPIDQGEELFLAEGSQAADDFLSLLAALAGNESVPLIILVTIRSDSYEQLQTAPALDQITPRLYSLTPMPQGNYRMVIEGPIRRLNEAGRSLKLEEALTERLLDDIHRGGGKDALPLLAFTLERLYRDYGDGGDLRLDEYQAMGAIDGAIDAAVKQALKAGKADPRLPSDEAALISLLRRGLIPWLAGIDPDTQAPRRRVARAKEIPEEARPIIEHLVEQRLLATDVNDEGETTIEPAHEALLRQWGLLKGWLKEDFVALTTLEALQRATRDWEANSQDDKYLVHIAGRLEDAEALNSRPDLGEALTQSDCAYLQSCRQREDEQRNRELKRARELAGAREREVQAQKREAEAQKRESEAQRKELEAQRLAAQETERALEQQKLVTKRTRLGLVAALLVLLLAMAAGMLGWQALLQGKTARVERDRANQTLHLVRNNLEFMNFELSNAIEHYVPLSVREDLTGRMGLLLQQLEAHSTDSIEDIRIKAMGLTRRADALQLSSDMDFAIVLELRRKAQKLFEQLVDENPGNTQYQRDLLISFDRIGELHAMRGDLVLARSAFEESMEIARILRTSNPHNAEFQRELSISIIRLGDIHQELGEMTKARNAYEESMQMRQALASRDHTNSEYQRDLSVAHDRLGDLHYALGDFHGARSAYEASRDIRQALASRNESNTRFQRDLSISHSKIGDLHRVLGDLNAAHRAFDESKEIRKSLAAGDPSNTQFQRDLSISHNKLGEILHAMGSLYEAHSAHEASMKIRRTLAERDSANREFQRDLSISYRMLGDVQLAMGGLTEAQSSYEASMAIRKLLVARYSKDSRFQRDLSIILDRIGDWHLALGDLTKAGDAYEESMQIRQALASRHRNPEYQRDLSISRDRLSEVSLSTGSPITLQSAYEDIDSFLVEGGITDVRFRHDLPVFSTHIELDQSNYETSIEFASARESSDDWPQRDALIGHLRLSEKLNQLSPLAGSVPIRDLDDFTNPVLGELRDSTAKLADGRNASLYLVEGMLGDEVRVEVASSDFNAGLIVTDSVLYPITDRTFSSGVKRWVDVLVPANGAFVIVVTSQTSGETGTYELSIILE